MASAWSSWSYINGGLGAEPPAGSMGSGGEPESLLAFRHPMEAANLLYSS